MRNQLTVKKMQVSDETVGTMKILILDDNEIDRMRLLRLCEMAGLSFQATEASDIDGMREALDLNSFDLVFIDYVLTGETGLDAIKVLNDHPNQHAASIMIAGEGQIGIAVEAMRQGVSDYLTKSELTVPALQKSVATAIERQVMSFALTQERELRLSLEESVRTYANSCSSEMRSILSATLRRVRKLRTLELGDDSAGELGALEDSIDRLWDALPAFSAATGQALKQLPPRAEPRKLLDRPVLPVKAARMRQ